ncbi:MAG: hypothetical protein Kow0073_20310 [Immundisolibacter sp.]
MIVLASSDADILRRWSSGVPAGAVLAHDRTQLVRTLDGRPAPLVLLDLGLAGLGAASGAADLIARHPDSRVVALSRTPDQDEGLDLLRAGARGYCNLYIDPRLLGKVISAVQAGEVWIGRRLVDRLVELVAGASPGQPAAPAADVAALDGLTPREREIALLVGEGVNNKLIARRLGITERTVKAHLGSAFAKLGVSGRLQLALLITGRAGGVAERKNGQR